jgi:hypothetical protein
MVIFLLRLGFQVHHRGVAVFVVDNYKIRRSFLREGIQAVHRKRSKFCVLCYDKLFVVGSNSKPWKMHCDVTDKQKT